MFFQEKNRYDTSLLMQFLIALMFIAPTKLQLVKLIILFVICVFLMIDSRLVPSGSTIDVKIISVVIIYLFFNLYFLIKGSYNDLNTFFAILPSKFLFPLILFFVFILNNDNKKINFDNLMLTILLIISAYTIMYVGSGFMGLLPWSKSPILGTVFHNDVGYMSYFSQNITSLFIVVPYCITRYLMKKQQFLKRGLSALYLIAILIAIVAVFLTGRRSLLLLTFASPFLAYFLINIRKPRKIFAEIALIVVFASIFFTLVPIIGEVLDLNADKFSSLQKLFDMGPEREAQQEALLNGLIDNHFIGEGFGVNAEGSIRSNISGVYELTYIALLFQTGIVGFSIYLAFLLFVGVKGMQRLKQTEYTQPYLLPFLVGIIIVLIASYSNPYLGNFDYCWIIYAPIMFFYNPNKTKVKRYFENGVVINA